MEVRNRDNSVDLYDAEFIANAKKNTHNPFGAFLFEKLNEEKVESATIHKAPTSIEVAKGKVIRVNNQPGEIIEQSDRKYLVQADGSWKRII